MLSLFAPYTAEDMWERLGHQPSVALAGWPAVDPALLAEDTATVRRPGRGQGPGAAGGAAVGIDEAALREQALADPAVVRALDGRGVRTVVVRAPKLVNIVPA